MTIKKLHYLSGIIISVFIGLHLFNHTVSILGTENHLEMMESLRIIYRNIFAETLLLGSVFLQIFSGFNLFRTKRKTARSSFEKLQLWTGFYLAVFFLIHLSAILSGRYFLHLDTNFYFGVAGLNTFPFSLFFIPYYGLAILAFFGHVAAIHHQKMKMRIFSFSPQAQANAILVFGLVLTFVIFYGLTNHFQGVAIPKEYDVLIGK